MAVCVADAVSVCAADAVSPALTGPLSATVAAGCDGCLSQLHRNEGIIKTAAHTSIFQHLFMTSLLLRIRDGRLRTGNVALLRRIPSVYGQ